jgi:DNA-binding transcriptional regulator YdaS (Cro superfamily)
MSNLSVNDFPESKKPLVSAIIEAGGITAFSKLIGVSHAVVSSWIHVLTKGIPAERCIEIENITKGEIKRQDLRPDVFSSFISKKESTTEDRIKEASKILNEICKEIYVDRGRINLRKKSKINNKSMP